MTYRANWSFPTTVNFGAGRVNELPAACETLGIKNPLLVTDKGLANMPITVAALKSLSDEGLRAHLFADVDPNPNDKNLEAGIAAYRQGAHDGVIAFGGGSALDLGKLIAFQQAQMRPVWDFEDVGDWYLRAQTEAIAPIIAVPTTAGTGSEVGRAGVLTNAQTQVKKIIFHPKILPSIVICNPELTVGMPEIITVGTGMDAFSHCLEAYSSPFYHPMAQGIALEGMRLVKDNLPIVVADPTNLDARAHMMSAAAMGAVSFQKGLGAIHALSHPVGAIFNTHHGMTNAVIMPSVLEFNREFIEPAIDRAAAYLNIRGGFSGFLDYVHTLRDHLGVPKRLSEIGVTSDRIDDMAQMAIADPTAAANPRKLTLDAAKNLFHACI